MHLHVVLRIEREDEHSAAERHALTGSEDAAGDVAVPAADDRNVAAREACYSHVAGIRGKPCLAGDVDFVLHTPVRPRERAAAAEVLILRVRSARHHLGVDVGIRLHVDERQRIGKRQLHRRAPRSRHVGQERERRFDERADALGVVLEAFPVGKVGIVIQVVCQQLFSFFPFLARPFDRGELFQLLPGVFQVFDRDRQAVPLHARTALDVDRAAGKQLRSFPDADVGTDISVIVHDRERVGVAMVL